jgi:hypothetical protein
LAVETLDLAPGYRRKLILTISCTHETCTFSTACVAISAHEIVRALVRFGPHKLFKILCPERNSSKHRGSIADRTRVRVRIAEIDATFRSQRLTRLRAWQVANF